MNLALTSRPHFFTGQMIDYRDFNQLASRPDDLVASLLTQLYPGGGFLGSTPENSESFAIDIHDKLRLEINPGLAILPQGRPIFLRESKFIDLSPYLLDEQSKTLIVTAKGSTKGDRHYTDPEDETLTGFRSEKFEPEFEVSIQTHEPIRMQTNKEGIEIFRAILPAKASELRFLASNECWISDTELQLQFQQSPKTGLIDLRHRKMIAPTMANPLGVNKTLTLQQTLNSIELEIEKIAGVYLVPERFQIQSCLYSVQAELLSQPYQPQKLTFLVMKLGSRIALYLDQLIKKTETSRNDFKREIAFEALKILEPLQSIGALPIENELNRFIDLDRCLRDLLSFSEMSFNWSSAFRAALESLKNQPFEHRDQISISGRIFEKTDSVQLEQDQRWTSAPVVGHRRRIAATFLNGAEANREGAFIRQGRFVIRFEVKHSHQPLIILLNQSIRRSGTLIRYELNGKVVETVRHDDPRIENSWIHQGIVVSPDLLVTGENQLSIQIEKTDLDFGFFGAEFYQPLTGEVLK